MHSAGGIFGGEQPLDVGAMEYRIDPELAAVIPMLPRPFDDLAVTRANAAQLFKALKSTIATSGPAIEDRRISAPPGAPAMPVRIYRPSPAAILHLHGGGFVLGNLERRWTRCRSCSHGSGPKRAGAVFTVSQLASMIAYLESGPDPDETFATTWRGKPKPVMRWGTLVQALMHGAEHRTHVCTVLGANGIDPPDINVGANEDTLSGNRAGR